MAWLDWLNPFNLGEALAETLYGLASVLLYPIVKMLHPLFYILTEIGNSIVNIGGFIFWILNFVWTSIMWLVTALFPSPIAVMLGVLFVEVLALAFIKKVGGITIGGFSLGRG